MSGWVAFAFFGVLASIINTKGAEIPGYQGNPTKTSSKIFRSPKYSGVVFHEKRPQPDISAPLVLIIVRKTPKNANATQPGTDFNNLTFPHL